MLSQCGRNNICFSIFQLGQQGIQLVNLPPRTPLKTSATIQPGQAVGQVPAGTKPISSNTGPNTSGRSIIWSLKIDFILANSKHPLYSNPNPQSVSITNSPAHLGTCAFWEKFSLIIFNCITNPGRKPNSQIHPVIKQPFFRNRVHV